MESEVLYWEPAPSTVVKRRQPKRRIGFRSLSPREMNNKRILDMCILFVSLPVILPLGIITAIAIKLDSYGPVLFKQERVGLLGRSYMMYKFRSMTLNSEQNGSQFARENDDRVTPLGKFIRKYRIDELPQFWNVLKGDMSVIGPRPEQSSFVDIFNDEIENYQYRHMVKPGITGLAQVHHGYASTKRGTEVKLRYDLFYIKKYSLKIEFLIIWRTVKTILTGFGSR